MKLLVTFISLTILGTAWPGEQKSPSRELAARTLLDFHQSLEAKDFKKALGFLKFQKDITGKEAEIIEELSKLLNSSEISKKGIEILAKKGEWGPLAKLQSESEAKRMSRGLPADKCYGLFASRRQGAAFYWDGSRLLITYFNGIGALEKK